MFSLSLSRRVSGETFEIEWAKKKSTPLYVVLEIFSKVVMADVKFSVISMLMHIYAPLYKKSIHIHS